MSNSYSRDEFVKLMALAGFSFWLPSCTEEVIDSTAATEAKADSLQKESVDPVVTYSEDDVLFFKADAERYTELTIRFNKGIQKQPRIIALCKTTKGVQQAIDLARTEKLAIAVKSGGHSFEGFSINNDGLVIDLSLMNAMEWEGDYLVTGPSVKLKDLYDEILPKGRIIPAGSCGTVGLSGLALGGGYGFFGRKHGLTCDNLMELTLVNGNGDIVKAKAEDELLWGCRGGGNGNFGVVTEMKFQSHQAPTFFRSHRFKAYKLTPEKARALLELFFEKAAVLQASCFAAFVLNGNQLTLLVTTFESTYGSELNDMISSFKDVCDKYSPGVNKDLAKALKVYYGRLEPLYFKNASAGLYKRFSDVEGCIDQVIEKVVNGRGIIYQVNTMGGKINDPELAKHSAYPHRDKLFLSELQAYWDKPVQETGFVERFQDIQSLFAEAGVKDHYRNYPDLGFEDWERSYYGDHYERLQRLKEVHDPDNLFRYEQSVRKT